MQSKLFTENQLDQAAQMIIDGQVLAMPSETVYGLAADATNDYACQLIFAIKGRALDNPLISHFAHIEELTDYDIPVNALAKDLLSAFSPGPLTLVLPSSRGISSIAKAGLSTIAVRIPSHPLAQALIKAVGKPLVAPSANRSGRYSSTTAQMVLDQLNGRIAGVLDGGSCSVGLESTVLLVEDHKVTLLRYGAITPDAITQLIGQQRFAFASHLNHHHRKTERPLSPGAKYAHYQPLSPFRLFDEVQQLDSLPLLEQMVVLGLYDQQLWAKKSNFKELFLFDSPTSYAQGLYAHLAKADQIQPKAILAYHHESLGAALSDRLLRAADYHFLRRKS